MTQDKKPSLFDLLGVPTPASSKLAGELRSVKAPETRYEKAAKGPTDYEDFMHKLEFGGAPAEKNLYRTAHPPRVYPLTGASEDQTRALEATLKWSCGHGPYGARQVLRMGGLAGTGTDSRRTRL